MRDSSGGCRERVVLLQVGGTIVSLSFKIEVYYQRRSVVATWPTSCAWFCSITIYSCLILSVSSLLSLPILQGRYRVTTSSSASHLSSCTLFTLDHFIFCCLLPLLSAPYILLVGVRHWPCLLLGRVRAECLCILLAATRSALLSAAVSIAFHYPSRTEIRTHIPDHICPPSLPPPHFVRFSFSPLFSSMALFTFFPSKNSLHAHTRRSQGCNDQQTHE